MPQPTSPLKPDVDFGSNGLGIPGDTQAERFQSLIEALMAEFQHLQQKCGETARENSELQKQLRPILSKESTIVSSDPSREATDTTVTKHGKTSWNKSTAAKVSWNDSKAPLTPRENSDLQKQLHPVLPSETTFGSSDLSHGPTDDMNTVAKAAQPPVTPRQDHHVQLVEEEEEEFNFFTPGADQGKGRKGTAATKKPGKPGPRANVISSSLEPKEAPPLDEESPGQRGNAISSPLKQKEAPFLDDEIPLSTNTISSPLQPKQDPAMDDEDFNEANRNATIKVATRSSDSEEVAFHVAESKTSATVVSHVTSNPRTSINSAVISGRATIKEIKAKGTKSTWGNVLLDTVPAGVIFFNACTIGLSADIEPDSTVWDILETIFIVFYFLEFLLKIALFGPRAYYFGPDRYWNWFDFTCLMVSLLDIAMTYVFTFLPTTGSATGLMKMLRLARLLRIVRALHYSFFDELKQMLLGVVSGVRVLLWAIILLLVVVFFLGVALNSLYGEDQPELSNVPRAMLTVFRCYTDGCTAADGRPLQERLFHDYGAVFFFGYILSFMFVTVGIFNLIMAIFMDSVFSRSIKRKLHDLGASTETIEARIKESLALLIYDYADENPEWDQTELVGRIQSRVSGFSTSQLLESDVAINRDVFRNWLQNREFIDLLEDAGVEAATKAELFDVLDVDMGGELGLDELINGLMKLRGPITKSDIIAVRLKVNYLTGMFEEIVDKLETSAKE